ncbi:hypothetical protein PR048_007980 [Dryococelus australis]|uniref:Uncharacterized protein n=1 Tax=Dryococelus australis TaxID=614101 RepID=A0ABQ9HWM6_9NEOP|nr:hypothetical protein PR048_007980 [Dryococelus australis]
MKWTDSRLLRMSGACPEFINIFFFVRRGADLELWISRLVQVLWGRGGLVVRPSTKANRARFPAGLLPDFRQEGIVTDDASGRRVFSEITRFHRPFIRGAAPYSPHELQTPTVLTRVSLTVNELLRGEQLEIDLHLSLEKSIVIGKCRWLSGSPQSVEFGARPWPVRIVSELISDILIRIEGEGRKAADTARKEYIYYKHLSFLLPVCETKPPEETYDDHAVGTPTADIFPTSPARQKRKRNTVDVEEQQLILALSKNIEKRAVQHCDDNDGDRHFLLSLLPHFKALPDNVKLDVQEVQQCTSTGQLYSSTFNDMYPQHFSLGITAPHLPLNHYQKQDLLQPRTTNLAHPTFFILIITTPYIHLRRHHLVIVNHSSRVNPLHHQRQEAILCFRTLMCPAFVKTFSNEISQSDDATSGGAQEDDFFIGVHVYNCVFYRVNLAQERRHRAIETRHLVACTRDISGATESPGCVRIRQPRAWLRALEKCILDVTSHFRFPNSQQWHIMNPRITPSAKSDEEIQLAVYRWLRTTTKDLHFSRQTHASQYSSVIGIACDQARFSVLTSREYQGMEQRLSSENKTALSGAETGLKRRGGGGDVDSPLTSTGEAKTPDVQNTNATLSSKEPENFSQEPEITPEENIENVQEEFKA